MPSEAPSSSSSSSSSVLPSSSLFLCETEQETLRDEYGVKAADPCPVCALPVGRHARRPTSLSALLDAAPLSTMMAAVSSPSHSSSHLGKNTTLPKWKVDYHQAKPFLDKIEHLCLADGVDRCYAPSLLFVFCFQLCLSVLCCYVLSGGMCVALADVTHCCPLVLTSALHVAT